ncbi:Gfo/Idh/MocA family protein [Paenibacillus beijingensis]|uniref:Oxidoreductase n=1 Tax=Paenibacillus beijingensis TaxID=1126833 RepID=A0A0D5NET9_9BACL|nr:Gfo/Idh/MocA family oxidoreductase [Paenibacillus beijingensis]AJY73438.1 oxidoreductase [Paenibacillus beijingensis]
MIRIGLLSFWHVHAKDYAEEALKHPDTEIAAVWDEDPERGRREAERRGVPYYAELEELFASDRIDAVIVTTSTSVHHEVMIKAARAGKHIFTEKVVAATAHEAGEIIAAADEANVALTVSLPRLYEGYTRTIQSMLEKGLLGDLTLVRVRLSHNGATAGWLPEHFFNPAESGGGAMIDLGCHPMYLTRLFLGKPARVQAAYGYVTGREAEDNAVAVLQYDNGAIGIVEAGFVNAHSPFSIEVHGKDGTLLFSTHDNQLMFRSSRQTGTGQPEWSVIDKLPNVPGAFQIWVTHIKEGTRADENIRLAADLTSLMEASNRSAKEGRTVALSELQP